MGDGFIVYKVYPDGSGEKIAWFPYSSLCTKFVSSLHISDFLSNTTEQDIITIVTISQSSFEIFTHMSKELRG